MHVSLILTILWAGNCQLLWAGMLRTKEVRTRRWRTGLIAHYTALPGKVVEKMLGGSCIGQGCFSNHRAWREDPKAS